MNRIVLLAILAMTLAAGCKKKPRDVAPDSAPPPTPAPSGGGSGGITPAGGVGIVVNPSAALGGGGGGGAAQAVRKAARRTQALNELKNLGELIEGMRDPFGKMPTKEQILAALKNGAPAIHKAIEEGSYVLTGTTEGGGLWAYELDADKQPGLALIGGVATRSMPEDVQRYLRAN